MTSDVRSHIRGQIRPFPRIATYPTSWAGALTFEQIYDDLARYVTNVMKGKGIHRTNYLPDCIQHGFMALWLELVENRDFLAHKTRQQAVFFILARCKISTLRYYDDKYDSLEELMSYDWRSNWDEHTITGFSAPSAWWNSVEQWATWAAEIDIRIDVEQIMRKLAEKYADSFKHLVALYAVTTQVTRQDAAALAGVTPWNWHKTCTSSRRCSWSVTAIRCRRRNLLNVRTTVSSPRHTRNGASSTAADVSNPPRRC